jgi:hypothetical protein
MIGIPEEIVEIEYETEWERSIYTFIVNVELEQLYRRDIDRLEHALTVEDDDERIDAIETLLASLRKSLEVGIGNNPEYTKRDTYEHVAPGFKMHKETGEVYVYGIQSNKIVLEVKKERKPVNSSRKTIVKNGVRKDYMISHKFREFRVDRVLSGAV